MSNELASYIIAIPGMLLVAILVFIVLFSLKPEIEEIRSERAHHRDLTND